jgi:hypothetical protein
VAVREAKPDMRLCATLLTVSRLQHLYIYIHLQASQLPARTEPGRSALSGPNNNLHMAIGCLHFGPGHCEHWMGYVIRIFRSILQHWAYMEFLGLRVVHMRCIALYIIRACLYIKCLDTYYGMLRCYEQAGGLRIVIRLRPKIGDVNMYKLY